MVMVAGFVDFLIQNSTLEEKYREDAIYGMTLAVMAGKLAKREAVRAKSGWPPACAVILHQPKRPSKK